ncbi:hypothetical protein RND81_07G018100 [Saponaria officinalis]|uniref:CDT1 Geminin-binding domain-containing protein n=1 Tax=Saponaria officinalis TaxID=3572 RepID=A0AAW1JKY6_SAPOF
MESSATLIPFKSKKPHFTTPVKNHPPLGPSVVTPDRVSNPLTRICNQDSPLSVSDIRHTAVQLWKLSPSGFGFESGRVGAPVGKVEGSEDSPAFLPERYEMLCEFFNAMVSSIRLLRWKRVPTTLTKLTRNIESLTDRRFTLHHLAQLKHIIPEVIVVKKIRVQDEETSCMKEELLISLETDALQTDTIAKGTVGYSHLEAIFHSRIIDYVATHPEGDDVPEGELPELFYKPKQETEPSINNSSVVRPTTLTGPSFKRRFSSKVFSASITESSPAKVLPETPMEATFALAKVEHSISTVGIDATPVKTSSLPSKFETPAKCDSIPVKFASTPVDVVSTPARLMASTPALRTPKRSLITDDDSTVLPNKSAKRRALRFDENCDIVEEQSCEDDGDDEIDVHSPCSAASKDLMELMEKERKTLEQQDPVVMQAKKRQQLMAGVPKLFDMIQVLFQSIRRSVMTKEELIHKIITGHLDIVDKGEVDEQLKLLHEVAPEFLTEQSCLSGDTLIRLNKSSCAESIRAKLLAAK